MNWEESQEKWIRKYRENGNLAGFFSVNGLKGADMIGKIINENIPTGLCLDIGCGVLKKPSYMKAAPSVTFIGIDPIRGEDRDFPFMECKAENLLFLDDTFDGVLFATSLNHLENPRQALKEAYRVLKEDGFLFVWNGVNSMDESHLWSFNRQSLNMLLSDFKSVRSLLVHPQKTNNKETIIIMKK